jgi:hypothetical protein|tara:strand:- start:303 stop:515 length:213 start_codon:yes stop_codon:yes gene_type:complete
MKKDGNKTNLKAMMRDLGVSMQSVADHSGTSKTDVSRVMNDELEEVVMLAVVKLLKEKSAKHQETLAKFN